MPPPGGGEGAARGDAAQAAGEARSRYERLYDFAPVGYCTLGAEGAILEANLTAAGILGVARAALVGLDLPRFIREQDRGAFSAALAGLGAPGETRTCDLRMARGDGSPFWARLRLVPAPAGPEGPREILAVLVDATERKQTEETLRRDQDRLSQILEATQVATWEWNVQTGEASFDALWAAMVGYTLAELQPITIATWEALCHPEDLPRTYGAAELHFAGQAPFYECECRMKHKDGRWIWIQDAGRVVSRTADGRPLLMVGTHSDITGRKGVEETLRRNRERLAQIVEATQVGTWEWDIPTGGMEINARWAEMLGYRPEELQPISIQTWLDLAHPEDLARNRELLDRHFAGELPIHDFQMRLRHRDGSWVWVQDRGRVMERAPDGTPVRMYGTHTDITARKQAEAALVESEQRLAWALEATGEGVWDWDVAQDRVTHNHQWSRILGLGDGYACHSFQQFDTLLHEDDRPLVHARIEAGLRPGGKYRSEHRLRHADGSWIWVSDRGEVVVRGADGAPLRMVGSYADITERKKAEEALLRISTAVEQSPVSVIITDASWNIQYVNPQFTAATGYSAAEVLGRNPSLLRSGELPEGVYQGLWDTVVAGGIWRGEFHNRRKDGGLFWESASISPVRDGSGRITNFVEVKEDITARKAAEEQLQETNRGLQAAMDLAFEMAAVAERANAGKSEFLANMSHEIRTPMNGVLGMAELLAGSDLGPEQREWVSAIIRSGDALMSLLNDLLDFSKIDAGQLTLERVPLDLEPLVFDVAELFRSRLEGRPVELLVDFDPAMPHRVLGDPGRIRQVLNNLVSNAIKFTARGYILVEVRGQPAGEGRWTYGLTVRDTGIGIPKDRQARLFQPFVQADSSTARRFGGTGLGLTLVKRIVEAMDGTIRLESEEGLGTSLMVDLPLLVDGEAGAPPPAGSELAGKRILVIDDLAINRKLQCRHLEAHGAAALAAPSGEEALRLVEEALDRNEPFDAALVDLHMPPGMDGAAFGRAVRSDPRCAPMALVVLTGTSAHGEVARLAEIGFDGYLFKPIRGDTLARALESALRRARGKAGGSLVTRHSLAGGSQARPLESLLRIPARILLVEDQEVNQVVARKFLEGAGATVAVAGNGIVALERLAAGAYDLVLMDCQMPVMDGFEATRRIRALEEGTGRRVPIIAMTAHAMAGDRDRCLEVGMDDYLAKPITRESLLRGLARWASPEAPPPAAAPPPGEGPRLPAAPPEVDLDEALFANLWEVFDRSPQEMATVVIGPFTGRGEELLHALRQGLTAGDREGIRSAAHSLKGSSRTLGLNALGRVAERLEREGATAPAEVLAEWIDQADAAFAVASAFLRSIADP